MTDLIERLRAWSVYGKLLQPYEVKPLLREAATILERQAALLAEAMEALSDCAEVLDYVTPDGTDFDMSVDTTRTRARSVLKALEAEGE